MRTSASPLHAVPDRAVAPRHADLDNLRTCLTALVICHHSAIAFGASGGWYLVIPPPRGSTAHSC